MDAMLVFSLFTTLVTLGFSGLVLYVWFPNLKRIGKRKLTGSDLLVIGIVFSFCAVIGDNVYWGLTWLSKAQHWPHSAWWFNHGPLSNVVFRHGLKVVAAVCHLEAARRAGVADAGDLILKSGFVVAVSAVVFLWIVL